MPDAGTLSVRVIKGHCLGGPGNDVFPGQVLTAPGDISVKQAERMIRIGYAVRSKAAPPKPAPDPGGEADVKVTTRDPAPEHRDPPVTKPPAKKSRLKKKRKRPKP